MTQTSQTPEIQISGSSMAGMAIRLSMLMTHYRSPINWTQERMEQADKTYRKWLKISAEAKTEIPPPTEFLEAMMDDLNTPKAISIMHGYAKRKEAENLFSSMMILGLLPEEVQKALKK